MNKLLANIVIVGRSNVGKSTLYNTLLGKREAITGDELGLTRDYQIHKCNLSGIQFNLIDTGGYNMQKNEISKNMNETIKIQVMKADIIFFMVDSSVSFTSEDRECWKLLREKKKNVILLANKAELKTSKDHEYQLNEFGIEDIVKITALSKNSLPSIYNSIRDKILRIQKITNTNKEAIESTIRISIVGQPNVGKSTLFNLLYGEKRVITAAISGTTRDSISSKTIYENYCFEIVDTAGIRKRNKISLDVEKASTYFSRKEIRYANCVILVIDVLKGISNQDINLSNYILKEGRSIMLVFNKWDLIQDKLSKRKEILNKVERVFFDAKGISTLFISSKEVLSRDKVFRALKILFLKWNKKVNTSELNNWFAKIWKETEAQKFPGSLKLKYISQKKTRPPTFLVYHNKNSKVSKVVKRQITNKIREKFQLEGTPIRVNLLSAKNPFKKKK